MRIQDIQRNKKWLLCEIQVDSITEPLETQFKGFVQSLEVTFSQGVKDVINYYFTLPEFAIDTHDIGPRWYKILWTGEYFKCVPAEAQKEIASSSPDWYKINLGKCRHGILVACIQSGCQLADLAEEDGESQILINKLAEFSMGEKHT